MMEFIDCQKNEDKKAEWLEKRRHYVTGTDAAKLLGLAPSSWGELYSVWRDKTGCAEEIRPSEAMQWGLRLEGDILRAYAEMNDCRLERVDGYDLHTSERFPRLACSLDGWNHDAGCPVDAKNIGWKNEKWGDAWTSEFPDYYRAQLQVQMMVTGAREAHLAVLFSGQQFVPYRMEYDEELAGKIVEAADMFWELVESGRTPPVDGSKGASDYIKEKFAKGTEGKEIAPTDEAKWLVTQIAKARATIKAAEEEEEKYSNRLKGIMEDATVITGFCTWKNNKDSVTVDWKETAAAAMESMDQEEREALVAKFTRTKPGARQLRITAKGLV